MMNSFLGRFTNLVAGFFKWNIDEYDMLINNFFKGKKINNERDLNLFCNLFVNGSLAENYIVYTKTKDSFSIIKEKPEGDSVSLIQGKNKIDSIIKTIDGAKDHYSLNDANTKGLDKCVNLIKKWIKKDSDRSNLVKLVWNNVGKEDESALSDLYLEKLRVAFYSLMKSLLIGEYLIIDNYLTQLQSCRQMVHDLNDDDEIVFLGKHIPGFKALIENSYHAIRSACSTIMDSLKEPAKVQQFTFYIGGVGDHHFYSDYDLSIEEKYQAAIEALVHVILIDHIFITTPHNIETLHWAASIVQRVPGMESDPIIQEICNPLIDKIYMIMRQMLDDMSEEPQLQTRFRFGEESLESHIRSRSFKGIESNPFPFNQSGVFRLFTNFEKDLGKVTWNHKTGYAWIDAHNLLAYKNAKVRREKHQRIREAIKNKSVSLFKDLEKIAQNPSEHSILTTSLLYHIIRFVDEEINITEEITFERKHKLMSFLLGWLGQMVKSYSSCGIIPDKFSLPFSMCFYSVDNYFSSQKDAKHELTPVKEPDYEAFQDTIKLFEGKPVTLFLSAGLKPTNINFLSRFVERIKNKELQAYSSLQEDRIIERADKQWELRRSEIQKDLDNQKNTSLQLVGYMGSFIAFVAVATNAFRIDGLTPGKVGQLLLVITSCILSFAVMIRLITLPKNIVWKDSWFSILLSMALAAALIWILALALLKWGALQSLVPFFL